MKKKNENKKIGKEKKKIIMLVVGSTVPLPNRSEGSHVFALEVFYFWFNQ